MSAYDRWKEAEAAEARRGEDELIKLADLVERVGRWHGETFPDAPPAAPALKLVEEARELVYDPNAEEAADCLICLLAWLPLNGLSLADLLQAADAKLEVLKGREWVTDARGVSQHTPDAPKIVSGSRVLSPVETDDSGKAPLREENHYDPDRERSYELEQKLKRLAEQEGQL